MNKTTLIKLIVAIIILVLVLKILSSYHFFSHSSSRISSPAIPDHPSAIAQEQMNTQLTNETLKTSLRKMAMLPEKYIAGCMKTPTSCQCLDQQGKKIEVNQSVCEKNVRDSSANQFKVIVPPMH